MADQERTVAFPAREAAELLLEIRRTRQRPAGLPQRLQPQTVEDAYAMQDVVVERLGGIGGWKIVFPAPGASPRCSPIPASEIVASGAVLDWDAFLLPEVEVEVAVVLGRDLPPRPDPYTPEEIKAAIARVTGAFELLGSRFADRTAATRTESLADLLSSAGVVIGDGDGRFDRTEFADVAMSLTFDGVVVGTASGGPSSSEVLDTLAWLANHACGRCGGLRAGQVVITGARIHPISLPSHGVRMTAQVAGLGHVDATFRGSASVSRG
jgi:2-keto-4-pentenoate hydratase